MRLKGAIVAPESTCRAQSVSRSLTFAPALTGGTGASGHRRARDRGPLRGRAVGYVTHEQPTFEIPLGSH
jgi:hypothetical protein